MSDARRTDQILKWIPMIPFRKIFSNILQAPKFPTIALLIFLICGVFGHLIAPHDPNQTSFQHSLLPPFWMKGGLASYPLGSDHLGRDILSRIIVGAGVSLEVGILTAFFSGLLGALVATLGGYLGGKIDTLLMRLVDMVLSMPFLVLAVTLAAIIGASKYNLIIILAGVAWAWYARVLRAEVLKIKEGDFIRLAIVAGCSKTRIMVRHVFPNIVNSLVVLATLNLGVVIIAEASLSFLGLGIPPPAPAWGSMISEGRNYIGQAWWLSVWPGVAILLVVLSFNLLGDWLRVRLDPKFRQTRL